MKLPKLAIENHQFTLVALGLMILYGIVSYFNMPRSEDPKVNVPGSSIIVVYPGFSPLGMEQLIVDPIEEVINELEDIRTLESYANDGIATVAVEFDPGSDSDEKYSDVVQKVNSVRNRLPEDIFDLEIIKWTVTDVSIFQIALISESATYAALEREAERLKKRMERTVGVKDVNIWALPQRQVRVSIDLEMMARLRIPLSHVIGAVQDANTDIPGGYVDVGSKRLNIKTSGAYETLDDIRYTLIHSQGGKNVFLKDVADVNYDYEDTNHIARVNGRRAVYVTLTQKLDTNIFQIADRVKPQIEAFRAELPASVSLDIVFDQSKSVSDRVNRFFNNLFQGILLVGIVVFTAVGWRAAAIVMLAIPVSSLIGIGLVDISGYGLQQMTIAGLVIALGLLVDNAIVVTENISRYMKMGHNRREAAVLGTSEVGYAVMSATATTVLAFIPIIMMRDVTGDFIRSMPVTVVYTLSASLFISLTITPFLSSRFLRVADGRKQPFRRFLNRFIEKYYRRILEYALNKPLRVLAAALAVFLLSISLFPLVGVSFFPKAEKPFFFINVELPVGISLDHTDSVARHVEGVLSKQPEVKRIIANVGHGNPQLYYNVHPKRNRSNHAQFFVEIQEYDHHRMDRLVKGLRDEFASFPGARIEVKELEQGPPVEAPVAIRLIGDDLDRLKIIADDVEAIIADQEGTVNIGNPFGTTKSDLRVNINREKASMLGVALSDIDLTVRAAMTGLPVSVFQDAHGEDFDIVVRMPTDGKPTLADFHRIHVASRSGALVPLSQLANIEFLASPLAVNHFRMERSVMITADVEGGRSVNDITNKIIDRLDDYTWPKGYSYYVAGEKESQEESFGGMTRAILIAVIAIFGVLVLQFRSYAQPIIVFAAIPLAVIGSIFGLLITGNPFSFTAFIGLTSLVGIVVNNSIILVDFTNQLRRRGEDLMTALKTAGETRFIPILLTTMTTIGGLLPLTLIGGSMWGPMGWTIIGGLLASTILTLIIVPVLYKVVTK